MRRVNGHVVPPPHFHKAGEAAGIQRHLGRCSMFQDPQPAAASSTTTTTLARPPRYAFGLLETPRSAGGDRSASSSTGRPASGSASEPSRGHQAPSGFTPSGGSCGNGGLSRGLGCPWLVRDYYPSLMAQRAVKSQPHGSGVGLMDLSVLLKALRLGKMVVQARLILSGYGFKLNHG
eukprot:g38410.t1